MPYLRQSGPHDQRHTRSRFRITRSHRRFLSIALLHDQSPLPEPSSAAGGGGAENKSWNFLKYSLVAALTGGAATAGYATYAYSLTEVEERTKAWRTSANYTVGDSASGFD
ncbi:hypothetical protein RDI58_019118 [Solanum bulbocastanum]|uniref:Uncharacterized protein n=1 Tax=Solanum bulbocastanum TaxID=147425 RepID=A0AAN8TJ89_SOLBU